MEYRIDIYKQIRSFYTIVFNGTHDMRPAHISLYIFLLNQNNRCMWIEWFKCPFDLAMQGALINSKNTYYAILSDLAKFKLIEYRKGINLHRAPQIKIIPLTIPEIDTVTIPLPDTLTEPLSDTVTNTLTIPLTEPLSEHIYKLLTDNFKLITDNLEQILSGLKNPVAKKTDFDFIDQILNEFCDAHLKVFGQPYEIIARGKERSAAGKLLNYYKKKFPDAKGDEVLSGMGAYFFKCCTVDNRWLKQNMSPSIILSKFNDINKLLKDGKTTGIDPDQFERDSQQYGAERRAFYAEREKRNANAKQSTGTET